MTYKVVEKFISINGEGSLAGQLSVFIRFAECNLRCSYCDTKWANEKTVEYDLMTANEIYQFIKDSGISNVTLTGGEPLLQKDIITLLKLLATDKSINTEIETNGSIDLKLFAEIEENPPSFTMDYKLPSSDMENKMILKNFHYIERKDVVKFVVGNIEDMERAKEIIDKYALTDRTNVYISPVYTQIDLAKIVDFLKDNKMNKVNLQVQLHKIIWSANKRGV